MTQYKFTLSAEHDIEEIVDYTLSKWGKTQTIKYLEELKNCTTIISHNPNVGINRKEIMDIIFSFPFKEHIIYYTKESDCIVIIRIFHKHMCPTLHKFSLF